jgi:hypothetical protein
LSCAPSNYYQAVEEFFVSRRGDPLFISNADWLLIDRWKRRGIPLRIVLRGIGDALDGHAHSWSRRQKVGSLAYCDGEVDSAAERWQRALALGQEETARLPELLGALADRLEAGVDLGPVSRPLVEATVQELRERAGHAAGARETETWLFERETELREALAQDLGTETIERLCAEIERELVPYRDRMPRQVQDQIRSEALTRGLFEIRDLPRLTLFQ